MEYRGYDSVGIATLSSGIQISKGVGKVSEVNSQCNLDKLSGKTGIGHTRWATHGKVSVENAHPHLATEYGNVAVVHNGIIENYEDLKLTVKQPFQSETDTEVIAHLLGHYFATICDAKTAMQRTIAQLQGNYAFIALFDDGSIAAARNHEPLIVGIAPTGYIIASDVLGFIEHTDEAIYLENREFVVIRPEKAGGIEFYNFQGHSVSHQSVKLSKELVDAQKEEYAHFTLKEINEQKETVIKAGLHNPEELGKVLDGISASTWEGEPLYVTGSGSSFHAALVGKYLLAKHANIRIEPVLSSESRFSSYGFTGRSVLVAISQSGESADVLDTVHLAKDKGTRIYAIVNNLTSSLARIADVAVGLNCGTEVGVAATKSFTSQVSILLRMAGCLSKTPFSLPENAIVSAIKTALKTLAPVQQAAAELRDATDVYILGRGVHYPVALEAALKLKEMAYIHAEGLPGGEMKHGPLALMDDKAYVILMNPSDETHQDMLISGMQAKSRGAKIIGISDKNNPVYDLWIPIPAVNSLISPLIEIIPIQLLGYHLALARNTDPDFPRNIAKSVTVR
jgi:glucosamine--fructose-6-phosphate aminotransferase (isomerizing)